MPFVDEVLEDPIPDETGIEPDRTAVEAFFDKLHSEDNAGKDDDIPPVEESLEWR